MGENILFHEQVHEVPSRKVLHDKVKIICVLEGTFESHHPRVVLRISQHVPFLARLHDLVLKDHLALLQFFHRHWIVALVPLAQTHLSEGPLADYAHRFEVENGDSLTFLSELLGLLVTDLFFDFPLLIGGEAEGLHLLVELFPVLLLLLFLLDHLGVSLLDEILGRLYFLPCGLGNGRLFRHRFESQYAIINPTHNHPITHHISPSDNWEHFA